MAKKRNTPRPAPSPEPIEASPDPIEASPVEAPAPAAPALAAPAPQAPAPAPTSPPAKACPCGCAEVVPQRTFETNRLLFEGNLIVWQSVQCANPGCGRRRIIKTTTSAGAIR